MHKVKTDHEVVMVTEFSQTVTGFLVSGVTEIHRVGWEDVLPPTGYLASAGTGSIVGLVERQGHFIQLLDLERVIAELDPEAGKRALENVMRSEKRYKALVADDSATIRLMLKRLLEAANFELDIVDNGKVAMQRLSECKNRVEAGEAELNDFYDVVIADIEMPQKDGFSLSKDIKSDPVLKDLPVILYSSIIYDEIRHKGEAVGADDQVSKPEMDKMAERAIKLIESRES
jgi:two-component system chemotaxis response regulator CheV